MSDERVYLATRKVFALYASLLKAVADELGIGKALVLHAKAHEEQGFASAVLIKQKLGGAKVDIETLSNVLRDSNRSIGIDSQLAQADERVACFRNSQCPMYDGYRMGGLDDETAEALCQVGAAAKLGTMLKQIDPRIKYRVKHYRVRPEEPCEEEISCEN